MRYRIPKIRALRGPRGTRVTNGPLVCGCGLDVLLPGAYVAFDRATSRFYLLCSSCHLAGGPGRVGEVRLARLLKGWKSGACEALTGQPWFVEERFLEFVQYLRALWTNKGDVPEAYLEHLGKIRGKERVVAKWLDEDGMEQCVTAWTWYVEDVGSLQPLQRRKNGSMLDGVTRRVTNT